MAQVIWKKDAYAGQRCFILGTGTSIMMEDLRPLEHEFTIGCNGLFMWKGFPFTPTVYCMIDHPAFGMWHRQIEELDTFRVAGLRELQTWPDDVSEKWKVIDQRRDMAVYEGYWNGYLTDFEWCAARSNVVWSLCAQLAFWWGFQEVYMLGVDGGPRIHCYDLMSYTSGDKEVGTAIPGKGDLHIQKTIIEGTRHFSEAGRTIINLNPKSKTGWEPYDVTLEGVLK